MRSSIRKNPKKAVQSKGPGIIVGKGIDIQDQFPKILDIKLPEKHRKGHFFCFGTTGAGKTKVMESMISQDIEKGKSVVCLDPKGDIELVSKIVQKAFETGREADLCMTSPIYPQFSAKIDPLSYYAMPEELISHVISGIQSKDEFFVNIAYETTLMIVKALILLKKNGHPDIHINFDAIYHECSFDAIGALYNRIKGFDSLEAEEVKVGINHILGSTSEYFSKVASTLRTVLTSLSTGSVGQIIGKSTSNDFMKRLEEGKRVILIVQTGSMLAGKTAHMVGRVIISMIQTFAGRKLASGDKINPPLSLYMDEFSNVAYLNIEALFAMGRSANVICHAFTQSVADLNDAIGPAKARKILDNTNIKLFMRVNDPETAKYIADYSGTIKKFSPIIQTGGMITIREEQEPTILMEDVMNLREQDFYFFSIAGGYKGRSLHVESPYLNVIYPELKSC
jgi:conjugal transfer pilus assembly protein TraD